MVTGLAREFVATHPGKADVGEKDSDRVVGSENIERLCRRFALPPKGIYFNLSAQ